MPGGSYWRWLLLWLRELLYYTAIGRQSKHSQKSLYNRLYRKIGEINELFITGHLQRPDHNRISQAFTSVCEYRKTATFTEKYYTDHVHCMEIGNVKKDMLV